MNQQIIRRSTKSSIKVFAVSSVGFILQFPLMTDWRNNIIGMPLIVTMITLGVIMGFLSFQTVFAMTNQKTRRLFIIIAFQFILWPLLFFLLSLLSLPAVMAVSCEHSSLLKRILTTLEEDFDLKESCSSSPWIKKWRLHIAWIGAALMFSMLNVQLGNSIETRNLINSTKGQAWFREEMARQRAEEGENRGVILSEMRRSASIRQEAEIENASSLASLNDMRERSVREQQGQSGQDSFETHSVYDVVEPHHPVWSGIGATDADRGDVEII